MARHLRHPTTEDFEDARAVAHAKRPHSKSGERFLKWSRTAWGFFSGAATLFFILLVWAANIGSCFAPRPAGTRSPLIPHSPGSDSEADGRLASRLEDAWSSLARPDESLTIWIIDDPALNAASLGNGVFVLWRGLVKLSDESLDAVLAHELAHDRLGHARRAADLADVTDFIGNVLGVLSGSDEPTTATLKRWSGNLVIPRYSRQQENEADASAVVLLTRLGYPDGAATMCVAFRYLRAEVGEGGGGWLSSHPGVSDRIRAIRDLHPSLAAQRLCR